LRPLTDVQNMSSSIPGCEDGIEIKKRVFILTDGQVSDSGAVIEQAREKSDTVRVFTFGLGSGCDVDLCEKTASAGRGTCSIVKDGASDLNGQVIGALQKAAEPSLKDCSITWLLESPEELNEVFRNQSIISTRIIPKAQFDNLTFSFASKEDPLTKEPINMQFTGLDFSEVTGEAGETLVKFAALKQIQATADVKQQVVLSLKYKVLCDQTAMVGVIKQDKKSIFDIREVVVKFESKQRDFPTTE